MREGISHSGLGCAQKKSSLSSHLRSAMSCFQRLPTAFALQGERRERKNGNALCSFSPLRRPFPSLSRKRKRQRYNSTCACLPAVTTPAAGPVPSCPRYRTISFAVSCLPRVLGLFEVGEEVDHGQHVLGHGVRHEGGVPLELDHYPAGGAASREAVGQAQVAEQLEPLI